MGHKLLLTCLFGWILSATVIAQTPHKIHFKANKNEPKISYNFKIDEVIDDRINTEIIGMVQKGLSNRKTPAVTKEALVNVIHDYLDQVFIKSAKRSLVMKLNEFWVSEKTMFAKERGRFEISFELLEVVDMDTLSLGFYSADIEGKGMDVTKNHDKRIKEGIRAAFENFIAGRQSEEVSDERLDFSLGIPEDLKEGFYESYIDLVRNTPAKDTMTTGEVNRVNDDISRYYLKKADGKKAKYYAYKSEKELYLNVYSFGNVASHYLKPKTNGRYLGFVEKVADPAAAAGFGLLGAAASSKKRLYILDLYTGEVSLCNKDFLLPIIKDYPDLADEHRKTKQKIPDRIELMQWINDRIKEEQN